MASKGKTTTAGANGENGLPAEGTEDLQRVRTILFGGQIRDFESRLQAMQTRLDEDLERVRDDLRRRVDAVERFAKESLDELGRRLQDETGARVEGQERNEQSIARAAEAASHERREIREQILAQSHELRDELERRARDLADPDERTRDRPPGEQDRPGRPRRAPR